MKFPRRYALALGAAFAVGFARRGRADLLERTQRPVNLEGPLDALTTRITPLSSFYVRCHFDAPAVDAAAWRLQVGGVVDAPLALTLKDLAALPQVTVEAVLQCAGNGRGLMRPRVPGVQWGKGAVGSAAWRGPRLRDVLKKAGVKDGPSHVVMAGADRPVLPDVPRFTRSLPLERALHEDTLVATHMNGVPLPALHGGPARVVVPGWVGDDWMKWLTELTVQDKEADGFFMQAGYKMPVEPIAPGTDVPPEQKRTMTSLNVKSLIGLPAAGAVVAQGKLDVVGVAFSGGEPIEAVDVSADGGTTWTAAKLEGERTKYGFRVFRHKLTAAPGTLELRSRAKDAAGAVQPEAPVWNPSGYLHNAIDVVTVTVTVKGKP